MKDLDRRSFLRIAGTSLGVGALYRVICDLFCGSGHGNMKMTLVVN